MRLVKRLLLFLSITSLIFLVGNRIQFLASAKTPQEIQDEIVKYEQELTRLIGQSKTLSGQIAQFDAQIKLTSLKISQTEEKILLLGGRIDQLEGSLTSLTKAFSSRAVETYKIAKSGSVFFFLISSEDVNQAVTRFHYLQKIQEADRVLLEKLQKAQTLYKVEKGDQEALQTELEKQKENLASQKASKAKLLEITKNDEKRYQQLLASARAELEAIQAIMAGKGEESEAGSVNEGARIASIISGASACSTGTHLHFEVAKNGVNQNPANLLSGRPVEWDNSPDGSFSFGGSWSWPINDPVRITQGYGMTYFASVLKYYGGAPHTGIDMVNTSDYTVKAVKPGTLYRGAIGCRGGILRYVRVEQSEDYNTYYLHVNY